MKISKVALRCLVITAVCLFYVNRQIEIVKLSYKLRDKEKMLSEIIDRNRVLLYNNNSLKAPQYLAGMIRQNELNLSLPDTTSVAQIKIVRKKQPLLAQATRTSWKTSFLDAFVPKAEASLNLNRIEGFIR
ncbi:MAG: hypothetical protein KJ893_01320 [Candidatus Omnitrophica bacterium]|nr:hypothetical protein [Candidatus Omnitrophota bacterium]MBU4478010.1 hypothetical protein [Candidatus Omnitrophota bacterium]MCG2703943.1 hypothetical protein [Candidatus Omnitrophota bacterium]